MNTPRDMIDDEMLMRVLREGEPYAGVFGSCARKDNVRRNNTGTGSGNCGCRTQERRESRPEPRCGCERESERADCTAERAEKGCGEQRGSGNRPCDSCINDDRMKGFSLAMAYVPWQEWEKIYEDDMALARGTLFEALDLPWNQSGCDSGTCRKCGDHR